MTLKRVLFFAAVAVGLYLLWRWYQSRQNSGGEYVEEYADEPAADSIGGGGGGGLTPASSTPGVTSNPPTVDSKPPLVKAGGVRFPLGSIFAPLGARRSPATSQPPAVNLPVTQKTPEGRRLPFGTPSPLSNNVSRPDRNRNVPLKPVGRSTLGRGLIVRRPPPVPPKRGTRFF